jgi:two-component system CheB/CheR fusion protein
MNRRPLSSAGGVLPWYATGPSMTTRTESEDFEQLLEYLRQTRGFDFTAYKRTSLRRRVMKRMQTVSVPTFDAYLDYLELHQEEFAALFNTILINVTGFFRDPEVWAYLETVAVPQLLENRSDSRPLRVWSAGSAAGQEAYSVAMLLAEKFGVDRVREHAKIYATDVDEEALKEGRRAVFSVKDTEDLPAGFVERYFTIDGPAATMNRELRRAVMFGRLDLLQDAPISRIDLLLCRNTLMYFNAEAQARILSRFSFSVDGNGFLVLGRAEMLFSHGALFMPVDLQRRVFRVIAKANHRDRLGPLFMTGRDTMANGSSTQGRLRQAAFDADTTAQLVVDTSGVLISANAGARQQFAVGAADLGRPLQELEVSYRPVDLRSAMDRVAADRREVTIKEVEHFVAGHQRFFDVTVAPIFDEQRAMLGMRIVFNDSTSFHHLQSELNASKQELETAYEELQSTNEELETTNEELQSTVEELETTNEELQSTNEELETMNEELQSTNEELQPMNDELRTRGMESDFVNSYLESVFSSLRSGVVVLDRDYRIQVWNRRSEDLWGLRTDEAVGGQFQSLDIGLPVEQLAQAIRSVMNGEQAAVEKTVRAMTRLGKTIDCLVSMSNLTSAEGHSSGVILLMDEHSASPAAAPVS